MSAKPLSAAPRYFSEQVTAARRFHLRGAPARGASFYVVSGGLEHCQCDYVIDRPGFPHPLLEFVAAGAGRLVMRGEARALMPGSVFAYGRGIPHRIESDPARPLVKYFVALGGDGARDELRARGLAPGVVARVAHADRVRVLFDELIDLALGDRADREVECALAARYLLLTVARHLAPASHPEARAFATYKRCREYIEAHAFELREMREVARACHVDRAYLCRLFQRFGRERPSHYLQHIRMNRAAVALQSGGRLIKDIAIELGYGDAANFTRAFRKWFGVPPKSLLSST